MYSTSSVAVAICSVIFPIVAIIAVALRVYVRRRTSQPILSDDYLVFATLACTITLCIVFLSASINASLGKDLTEITPDDYVGYNKHIYAGVIAAYSSFGIIKMSVIEFYKRVFQKEARPEFHHVANGVLTVVIVWTVVTLFLAIFSAWPISDFWRLGADYAFNHPRFLFVSTVLDTALDLVILTLPFPQLWQLQMSMKRKLQLCGVFSTGFFCVIAAGLRIYFGWRLSTTGINTSHQVSNSEFSYIVVNNVIWCEAESCMAILAACLPTLRALFHLDQHQTPPSSFPSTSAPAIRNPTPPVSKPPAWPSSTWTPIQALPTYIPSTPAPSSRTPSSTPIPTIFPFRSPVSYFQRLVTRWQNWRAGPVTELPHSYTSQGQKSNVVWAPNGYCIGEMRPVAKRDGRRESRRLSARGGLEEGESRDYLVSGGLGMGEGKDGDEEMAIQVVGSFFEGDEEGRSFWERATGRGR